jgi:O-Antigen ligase
MALWRELRSWTSALLLVALAFALIRARDQPGVEVGLGGTTATVVPGDLLLAALAVVSVVLLARRRLDRVAIAALVSGAAFALVLLGTAMANGAGAVVAGLKLLELGALALGAIAIVRSEETLESIVDLLLLFTIAADLYGLVEFVHGGGGRQSSFLGEHDFAALASLPLLYGLVLLFEGRRPRRAAVAIVAGSIGCIIGAALASLLGLYLGAGLIVALAAFRRRLEVIPLAVTCVTIAIVTACSLTIRAGDLGFIQQWFGKPPSRPGQYAAGWSQRLIYVYVGGRVFAAHPFLGTGWYPDLPPKEYVAYLPAARRRFSTQPPTYFPPADGTFIPQQTYDQVLYELGVVGALAFLALLVSIGRAAVVSARWLRSLGDLPAVWFAATLGAIAGEGFFGGSPLASTFWLVAGVAVACASMAARDRA